MGLSTARVLLAGAGGAFLLFATPPAAQAQPAAPEPCRQECREARATCHVAGHLAYRTCREACREGDGACHEPCRHALDRAVQACRDELVECGVACGHELDPVCAAACREDRGDCRQELALCAGDCRDQARAVLMECRQVGASVDVRACLHASLEVAVQCRAACREQLPCGASFRACLGGCVIQP